MTKMVNSWNEWGPLKRVIVGRPEGTQVAAPEPGWLQHFPTYGFPAGSYGPIPQEFVDAANEQMDNFVGIMEKRGIIVDRVTVHPNLLDVRSFGTPDWTQLNSRGTNNPRDVFLPIGNEIMETPGTIRSRWYEYLHLRPLFEMYFKEDPEFLWTAAPKPRLTDESYHPNFFYNFENVWSKEEKIRKYFDWDFQLTEKEPLWDAADASRCGKDIFWQTSAVTNRSGMDWLKRYFSPKGIRIHPVQFDASYLHPWHIDCSLIAVRPGLAIYNPAGVPVTKELYQLFRLNDWELIPAAEPTHHYQKGVNGWIICGGEFEGPNWISMNTLSLGPNTICVEAHELKYIDQLTKLGFEVVEVPYDKVLPFGGALHCTTLDVYREGILEDYFPKQVPGY
jgi:glycine amidinotransferase